MANIELIKQLRNETAAGIADIKEALEATNDNLEAARDYLKKKGIAKADKRSEREANQGIIASYIHTTNKIGVLVELNCETDFVARNEDFLELGRNIAMQVCAMNPEFLSKESLPEGADMENIDERCLLSQKFFKDSSMTIEEMVKSISAKVGEAVKVKRFVRYEIGN
jgi:elongation factor Ts